MSDFWGVYVVTNEDQWALSDNLRIIQSGENKTMKMKYKSKNKYDNGGGRGVIPFFKSDDIIYGWSLSRWIIGPSNVCVLSI